MYYYLVRPHTLYRGSMFQQGFWCWNLLINTPPRELYRIILIDSSEKKTWWWPLPAETCSFLVIKNITSNWIYIVAFLTTYPLVSLYTHNGDGALQSFDYGCWGFGDFPQFRHFCCRVHPNFLSSGCRGPLARQCSTIDTTLTTSAWRLS